MMSVLVGSPFASTSRLAYLSWANNLIVNPDTGSELAQPLPRYIPSGTTLLLRTPFPLLLFTFVLSSTLRRRRRRPSPSLVSPSLRCPLASFIFFPFSFCTSLLYNSLFLGSHGQAAVELLGNASFQSVNHEVTFTLATVW